MEDRRGYSRLFLSFGKIRESEAQILSTLKNNEAVKELCLEFTEITPRATRELLEILKDNPYITKLILRPVIVDKATLEEKSGKIEYEVIEMLVDILENNSSLKKVDLGEASEISEDGVDLLVNVLENNTTLTELVLPKDCADERITEQLSKNKIIAVAPRLDYRIKAFKKAPEFLDLSRTSMDAMALDGVLEILRLNRTLTALDLSVNHIGDEGAKIIARDLPSFPGLDSLDLGINDISDDGALPLSEALKGSTVKRFSLKCSQLGGKKNTEKILKNLLEQNPTLTSLDMINCSLGGNIKTISDLLKTNSILMELSLGCNYITKEGAEELLKALQTNTTLQKLDMYLNCLGSEVGKALLDLLKQNENLTELGLSCTRLSAKGVNWISEALKTNTALISLNLTSNDMREEGVGMLSEVLKNNTSLIALNLSLNNIRDEGAHMLSEALKSNSTLTRLDLGNNLLTDVAAREVAEFMKTNSSLTDLDITKNRIGNGGITEILAALQNNTVLVSLKIIQCSRNYHVNLCLWEMLQANTTLTELDVSVTCIELREEPLNKRPRLDP